MIAETALRSGLPHSPDGSCVALAEAETLLRSQVTHPQRETLALAGQLDSELGGWTRGPPQRRTDQRATYKADKGQKAGPQVKVSGPLGPPRTAGRARPSEPPRNTARPRPSLQCDVSPAKPVPSRNPIYASPLHPVRGAPHWSTRRIPHDPAPRPPRPSAAGGPTCRSSRCGKIYPASRQAALLIPPDRP